MAKFIKQSFLGFLVSAFFLHFAVSNALAEKRVALLIGNSNYQYVPQLANPANDVKLLASVFSQLDFEVMEHQDLGRIGLIKAIRKFTTKLRENGPDTVGFVFYAGHGLQVKGINYLVPVDAEIGDESDVDVYSVKANDLMQDLISVGNGLNVIVLDSCRNNPYKARTRSLSRGLARMDAPNGSLIAYATSPGHVAEDGETGNSPFTSALSQELNSPGTTIEVIMKRVRQHVFGTTNGRQLPWTSSSILGDFCPAGCETGPSGSVPASTSVPKDRAHRAWVTIKDSKNPRILRSFAKKFPDSIYAEFASIKADDLRNRTTRGKPVSKQLIVAEKRELGATESEEHGRYFVIMGSFPKKNRTDAEKRLGFLRDEGIDAHIINTNDYPNLTNELYAVVQGPYNRDYAIFKRARAKLAVEDTYVKSGR